MIDNNTYNGQAEQDKFVLNILKYKTNGYFLELGANDPIYTNNTFILENKYNWKGIMIEGDASFIPEYNSKRANSIHVIKDATTINYNRLFTNRFRRT
jgi:hypothetical protein